MDAKLARSEMPIWSGSEDPVKKKMERKVNMSQKLEGFVRRYGITILVIAAVFMYGWMVSLIVEHNTRKEMQIEINAEVEARIAAYQEELRQQEQASYFLSGDASREAAWNQEADAIARAIGPMKTRRMKQTMIWNILMRVDSPYYPDTIQEVIAQPQQWMFYDEKNPIREDDRQLALEQLAIWHDGRYPSGLDNSCVYGEWTENDYVLRNTWDKSSSTGYWRMPE